MHSTRVNHFAMAQEGGVVAEYGLMVLFLAVALIAVVQVLTSYVIPLFSTP